MKKILAILIACFIVSSLMGQVVQRSFPDREGKMLMEAFESKNKIGLEMKEYQPASSKSSPEFLKSAQTVKQQLDSMAYEGPDNTGELVVYSKEIYTYTPDGDIKQIHWHDFYKTNFEVPLSNYKTEYAYDSNGNCIQNMTSFWSMSDNKWIAVLKDDKIYDSNGHLIQSANSAWNFNLSQWVGRSKADHVYNSSGQIIQNANYEWDKIDNQWVGVSKSELASDSIEGVSTFYTWDKITSLWVFESKSKHESTYDSNGNLTLSIDYRWDKITNQWVKYWKDESITGLNGIQTEFNQYLWNTTDQRWDTTNVMESTLDSIGRVVKVVHKYWDSSTKILSRYDKREYSYDTDGKLIFTLYYIGSSGQWTLNTKSEFTYDSNGKQTGTMNYAWDGVTSQWKIGEDTGNIYNSYGNKIQSIVSYKSDIRSKTTWYYSDVETSITAPVSAGEVKSFPNPASDYITFDIEGIAQPALIELIDMQGKKVIAQILPQNKQIQVSQLKSGMYFYKIQQGNKIYKGKVIVK